MVRSKRGEWIALDGVTSTRSDTWRRLEATPSTKESGVLKQAKYKATQILVGSAELYRELAISALSLVPRR